MLRAIMVGLSLGAAVAPLSAQTTIAPAEPTVVHGLYNFVHSTADAERTFAFYHDVLGIELAASPFALNAAAPEGIRPWSAVRADGCWAMSRSIRRSAYGG